MQQENLSISVVVPTLNRSDYISKLIKSIVGQSLQPNQLIIVDQNSDNITKNTVNNIINEYPNIELIYIHDSSFNSLVQAKDIGANNATGDIVCFLDDDVILHAEYFAFIKSGFLQKRSDMLGCMGFITNGTKKSNLFLFMHKLFFQGIFADDRPKILSNITINSDMLIPTNVLSGGASSWRAEVFGKILFDTKNKMHFFEDIDFSERAINFYGNKFYVNTKAEMLHVTDQEERLDHYNIQKIKIFDAIIFYKKRANYPYVKKDLFFLLLWRLMESFTTSIKYRTISPLHGYISGVTNGIRKKI